VGADNTAGHRKGVHGGIVDHDQLQARIFQGAVLGQIVEQLFQIDLYFWVVEGFDPAAKGFQPGAAQLVFLLQGDNTG